MPHAHQPQDLAMHLLKRGCNVVAVHLPDGKLDPLRARARVCVCVRVRVRVCVC
jgi:hypothetical protein